MMIKKCRSNSLWVLAALAWAVIYMPARADEGRAPLPDPDGKPANMSKPVQVYILKSCIGNRSLGWDLLPPGSRRFSDPVGHSWPRNRER
jgi:hypothetical protein